MTGRRWRVASELRRECAVGEPEDVEQGAHNRGGTRDDDAGDDAHFPFGIAALHLLRAAPDVDDAPDETDHEQNPEAVLKPGFEFGRDLRERQRDNGSRGRIEQERETERSEGEFCALGFHGGERTGS
jgi:hypothetical protein